jgi:hypothetical protein
MNVFVITDDSFDVGGVSSTQPTFFSIASSVKTVNMARKLAKLLYKGDGRMIPSLQKEKAPKLENTYKMGLDNAVLKLGLRHVSLTHYHPQKRIIYEPVHLH